MKKYLIVICIIIITVCVGLFISYVLGLRTNIMYGALNEYLYSDYHVLRNEDNTLKMDDNYSLERSTTKITNQDKLDVDGDDNIDFTVLAQYHDETGLDIYLVKDKMNRPIISIRGTEATEIADLKTDASLGVGLFAPDQYSHMITITENVLKNPSNYGLKDNFKARDIKAITGHSLGGGLSMSLSLYLNDTQNVNIDVIGFNSSPFYYEGQDLISNTSLQNMTLYVTDNDPVYKLNTKILFGGTYNPYDFVTPIIIASNTGHSQGAMLGYLSNKAYTTNAWSIIYNKGVSNAKTKN